MEENNYDTPIYDSFLAEDGWQRFEGNPVYYKRDDSKTLSDEILYQITYHIFSTQKHFEEMLKINASKESALNFMQCGDMHCMSYLTVDKLLLETCFFYRANGDIKMNEIYEKKFELLTGIKL